MTEGDARSSPSFLCEQRARKKLTIFLLVKPRALDVEQFEARYQARQRERIDRQLRDWFVGVRIGLVIKNVHGAVAHLRKVDVTGDRSIGRTHIFLLSGLGWFSRTRRLRGGCLGV